MITIAAIARNMAGIYGDWRCSSVAGGLWYGWSRGTGPPKSSGVFVRCRPNEREASFTVELECEASFTFGARGEPAQREQAYAGTSPTPLSTTALSREGATTLARNRPSSFQMPTLSVSPGKATPANRAP